MNELAHDLGVSLELAVLEREEVVDWITTGRIDILAGGVAITPRRAARLGMTEPHLQASLALVVPDFDRRRFASAEALQKESDLTLAVPPIDYFERIVQEMFPDARIVSAASPRLYLRGEIPEADALVFSAESGSAWTMVYPDFTVVVPQGLDFKTPIAYAIPKADGDMKAFLDAWLALKKSNGMIDEFYRHWILGEDAVIREPRWSVLRDVLHIVE